MGFFLLPNCTAFSLRKRRLNTRLLLGFPGKIEGEEDEEEEEEEEEEENPVICFVSIIFFSWPVGNYGAEPLTMMLRTEIECEHIFIRKKRVQQISPVNRFLFCFFWNGRAITEFFLFSRPFIESNLVLWGPKSNGNTYLFEKRKKSPTDFCSSADLLSSRTRSRWVSSRVRRRGRCREPPEGWLALWWLSVRTKMAVSVSGKGGSLCGGSTFFILAAFARPAPAARLLWRRTPALGDLRPRRSSLSLSLSVCVFACVFACVCVWLRSQHSNQAGSRPLFTQYGRYGAVLSWFRICFFFVFYVLSMETFCSFRLEPRTAVLWAIFLFHQKFDLDPRISGGLSMRTLPFLSKIPYIPFDFWKKKE